MSNSPANMELWIEGELIAISLNDFSIEFEVRLESGQTVRSIAFNKSTAPVCVTTPQFSLRAGLQDFQGNPSLGQIEGVSSSAKGFLIEGDFGCVKVVADQHLLVAHKSE